MEQIKIAGRMVGPGAPCFVVAEAGVNHNGNFKLAKKMVEAAKRAGADAIKFQIFRSERMVARTAKKASYQRRATGGGSQYDMLKKLELTEDEFRKLAAYAKRKSIIFLVSAFDEKSVDFLANIKVPAFKVPSGEITNFPLLEHIAEKEKPVILSTGMSAIGEVAEAISVLRSRGVKKIVLLHCVSEYPTRTEDINLRVMDTLRRKFRLPVGISDHTIGLTVPIAAVALGAVAVEKHFTLSRKLPGPDHGASLEPDELREMVVGIREVEKALGNGIKEPTKGEEVIKKTIRRSVVAKMNIAKGTVITEKMLDLKRPGTGLEPKHLKKVVGKKAAKDMTPDELITFKKIK